MKTRTPIKLDPSCKTGAVREFEESLRSKIVGQDEALKRMTEAYQMYLAGLNPAERPVANFLFLGPTGVGKTRCVQAMAETMFGNPHAMIAIDCAEYQHGHEISKLVGSPPGYLGHRETHALLSQVNLDQHHTDSIKISLLLFDEIEKSSDTLWRLLLGILDRATLSLGDNSRVSLAKTVIFMTSNLGATEMSKMFGEHRLGFNGRPNTIDEKLEEKIEETAIRAAARRFDPEFMNRIDKVVVFKTLRESHLKQILELELDIVQRQLLTSACQFVFSCTDEMKNFLLEEGMDLKYGARHLKRAIQRHLIFPFANLVSTNQVALGDFVKVHVIKGEVTFLKEEAQATIPGNMQRAMAAPSTAITIVKRLSERSQYPEDSSKKEHTDQ